MAFFKSTVASRHDVLQHLHLSRGPNKPVTVGRRGRHPGISRKAEGAVVGPAVDMIGTNDG